MSQKELLEAISHQVEIQTDKIGEDAKETASGILRKAQAELGKIKEAAIERARHSVKSEEAKIINEARLSNKRELSSAKQALVDKVVKGLETSLAELSKKKEYRDIFHRLLKEALQDSTGPVTVRCRAEDRRLAEEFMAKAGKQATVQEIPLPLGGVEVAWGGDRFIRKNTLESRLQKIYPELLKETNRLLFGEKAP